MAVRSSPEMGAGMAAAVVAEALSWIGTPYRHQAARKGVGCDCFGLVRGVWRALYGVELEKPGAYAPDWAEAGGRERLLEGALGDAESAAQDSFEGDGLLDCPHYTRPVEHPLGRVPEVLLSGNHAEIARWRRQQALGRTWLRRPDLLDEAALSKADRALLEAFRAQWLAAAGEPPDGDA